MAFSFPLSPLFASTGRVNDDGSHSVAIVIGVSQFEIDITDDGLWLHVRLSSPHGTHGAGFVAARFHRPELLLGERIDAVELKLHGEVRRVPRPLTVEFPASQPEVYEGCEENYNILIRQDCGYFSINLEESSVLITPFDSLGQQMRGWELWLDAEGLDLMQDVDEAA